MKKLLFSLAIVAAVTAKSQDSVVIAPAAKGVVYGVAPLESATAATPDNLELKMVNGAFEGALTGKVKEVCKAKGCWITLEKGDGTTLMVKAKEHAFFMPQTLVGKTVVIEGNASVKEVTEAMRKHLAEDAGKSSAEINKIKGSTKNVEFVAGGVKVLN